MVRLGLCVVLLFAACAAGQIAPALPGTTGAGEPLPPALAPVPGGANAIPMVGSPSSPSGADAGSIPVPSPGDPGAEADFGAAKAEFEAGDRQKARAALEAFLSHHPENPARPAVALMLARLALLRGDATGAKELLEPVAAAPPDPGTGSSARYYLGLTEARLGHYAPARALLLPFLPPAGATGPGDDALVELRGALAEATAGVGELPAALALWDAYARGGRDAEKAYARERVADLAAKLGPDAALEVFRASTDEGLARALLGERAAAVLRASGDAAGAGEIDKETAVARRAIGIDPAGAGHAAGEPGRLGLAVALSGKYQPVGEAAMRAALLATGAPGAAAGRGMELFIRDTGSSADRVAGGIEELARDESVIGVVATLAPSNPGAAGRGAEPPGQARPTQVPTLALDDLGGGWLVPLYALVHSPAARAGALARAALKLGARDFATIGPDSAAGERLRRAFKVEVSRGGGRVVVDVSYPAGSTSFTALVSTLKKAHPQVVFVADDADRLELIAPALAAADLWPGPWGSKRAALPPGQPRGRNVLLLSTASGASERLLQNAGRYLQGALLAPGFYADGADPRARAFVDAYREAYGQDPHATEAYAFDGVNVFRAVVGAGARTRAEVIRALAAGTFEGLTGSLRFGGNHERADDPRIYAVEGGEIKVWP